MNEKEWRKESNRFQKIIINESQHSIAILHNFRQLVRDSDFKDKRVAELLQSVEQSLADGIESLSATLEEILPEIEWGSLNVGFFGETNAGKSTVIEALVGGDGKRIGDGRKDFTQRVDKVSELENSDAVVFLDMPGIEGDESKVKSDIRKAVAQSHVVVYIHGAKVPEEPTMAKIRDYLQDYARIYSVMNIRGKPAKYGRVKELLSKDEMATLHESKRAFSYFFGDQYCGAIALNAYLGFLAFGNPDRQRFDKQMTTAGEVFGDFARVRDFSEFWRLTGLIKALRNSGWSNIPISNTYKILKQHADLLASVLREKSSLDQLVKAIHEEANNSIAAIETIFQNCEDQVNSAVATILRRACGETKRQFGKSIDSGKSDAEKLSQLFDKIVQRCSQKLEVTVNKATEHLEKEIRTCLNQFEARLQLHAKDLRLSGKLQVEDIIDKLKISLSYVAGEILDIGWAILGIVIASISNIFVGIGTALLAVIRKTRSWFSHDPAKRAQEAKQRANKDIDKVFMKMEGECLGKLARGLEEDRHGLRKSINEIRRIAKVTREMSSSMNDSVHGIYQQQRVIATALGRLLLTSELRDLFVDLQLQEACSFGNLDGKLNEKCRVEELLRVHRLRHYQAHADFINDLEHREEDGMLVVTDNDEFKCRIARSLWKELGFTGIRRERTHAH